MPANTKKSESDKDKKQVKRKSMGRPIRGAKKLETPDPTPEPKEILTSSSPVQFTVGSEDSPDSAPQESEKSVEESVIVSQNIAESIVTEDASSAVNVRRSVSSSRLFILALFIGLLIGTVAFGGLIMYDSGIAIFPVMPTPTEEPSPSPSPTKVMLQLSTYKLQVLNGAGTSGAAKVVGDLLEEEGFASVDLGNAGEFGYEDTEVSLKRSLPSELFATIKKALSGYSVVEVTSLPSDAEYDVVITVGKKKSTTE